MNPDLINAARAVVAAKSRHPDLTPEEFHQIAQSYGQDGEKVAAYLQQLRADHGNLVASALKGITANWGDELVGMIPKSLGGGEDAKNEMRLRYELAALDHPIAAPLTEMAGGVGAAVATGGLAPEFATGSRIANAALEAGAVGGGYGVVSGAGGGEDAASRVHGAVREGATGTLLGGALGAVAGTLAEHTPSGVALRRQLDAIQQSGGIRALRKTLADFRAGGRGDLVTTADLSRPLAGVGDFGATNNPTVYNKAADIFEHRQPDITERLLNDVDEHIGTPDAHVRAQQLAEGKRDWANTAYDNLRDSGAEFSPEDLAPYLEHPKIKSALGEARLAGDLAPGSLMEQRLARLTNEGSVVKTPADQLNELQSRMAASGGNPAPEDKALAMRILNGEPVESVFKPSQPVVAPTRPLSFTDMQQTKRALDGLVGTAYRKGNVPLAQAYGNIRNAVVDAITNKVPEYAVVDAEYAAKSRLQDMLTQGQDAWNKIGVRQLQENLSKLSPADRDEFRLGLASKLVDSLRDVSTNRNVAKQLLDKGISMQEKLKVIFGDEDTFNNFMNRVKLEKKMADTRATVGGSATAKRTADVSFDPLPMLAGSFYGPHAALAGATRSLFRNPQRTSNIAKIVGDFAFTQGADKVEALLNKLTQPVSLLGHMPAVRIGQGTAIAAPHITSLFDQPQD